MDGDARLDLLVTAVSNSSSAIHLCAFHGSADASSVSEGAGCRSPPFCTLRLNLSAHVLASSMPERNLLDCAAVLADSLGGGHGQPLIVDWNGDRHPDLIIPQASSTATAATTTTTPALWLNDGHGAFAVAPKCVHSPAF